MTCDHFVEMVRHTYIVDFFQYGTTVHIEILGHHGGLKGHTGIIITVIIDNL